MPLPWKRPAESRRGRQRRRRLAAAISLLPIVAAGCALLGAGAGAGAATGAVAGDRLSPHAPAVAVALEPARDVAAVGARGDTLWLRRAYSLVGRVSVERGDTLWLALSEARGAEGTMSFARAEHGATATVVRGPGVNVRVINREPAVTEGALLGGVIGLVAVTFGVIVLLLWAARSS